MKRVNTVLSGCSEVIATMFGRTRFSQGIFHSVLSANIRCMSTQRCTALSPGDPYRNVSLFDMAFLQSQPAAGRLVPDPSSV
jgi:hypothetical protein